MAHGHAHAGHLHTRTSYGNARRLLVVFVLIALYTVAEALGGLYTGSLALLADAGHMLSDVAALGIALVAIYLARRPATHDRTYGLHRAEVLGALVNGVALVVIAASILFEAWRRFFEPPEVLGGAMLVVAAGGLVVNLAGLLILREGHEQSLNVRGAWLHMFADALGSLGAMVSGFLIWRFGLVLADPVASVFIGLLVLASSIALLRDTVNVLMEATPSRLDLREVSDSLEDMDGVESVHDLHVWTIASGREALTAHVVVDNGGSQRDLLSRLRAMLRDRFHLTHVTLQMERDETPCEVCFFDEDEPSPSSTIPEELPSGATR